MKKFLQAEKKKFGGSFDNGAYRYTLAEIYVEGQDFRLAHLCLNWFFKNFGDDSTYAYFQYGAARTKFEKRKFREAK